MNTNDQRLSSSTTSITQRVYSDLRDLIVTGQVVPGEKLKVEKLKARLDAGASPIREALSLLTSDHLVERFDQRGFRVAKADGAEFAEILKLRCALEDMALRESLAEATPEWEENLVLTHHRMVRTPRKNFFEFEKLHKAFHMALIGACESPILIKFCDRLYDLNVRYRCLAGRTEGYGSRDIATEHAEILAAAVDRDADRASACLQKHYTRTGQFLVKRLEHAELGGA